MSTMRVVETVEPGGPEALVVRERPRPEPGPDEVLIRIGAAGLNRADLLQRRGMYPPPPGAPSWPGLEAAGTVAAAGANVRDPKVGDKVCILLAGGGYAEYCVAPAVLCLPVPDDLSLVEGASLPEAYFTVWSNLYEFAHLKSGETVLVHGGSSGIGVTAIQLATALGSRVIVTAGSDDKCRFCERLGAVAAINYRTTDFVPAVQDLTQQRGVDVVLDMVGGSYLARNVAALAPDGRLVVIATQEGMKGELDLRSVMAKRIFVTGSMLRPRDIAFKRRIRDALLQHVWPLIANERLKPVIDRVFAFQDAAAAHAYMESGTHTGKIILEFPEAGHS
ncbi:MAG TPA: NAD(P)H-quinone oxidoreductase [Steroidobacteraceae bacterium]|nr:NAD(P)H-quinone oxidoreductase [Steroidobacteraceae bacterium]